MKTLEWKVRNEIFMVLMCHVKIYNNDEWKGHIREIWIEAKVIGSNTIINCYYSGIQFIRLVVSEGLMIEFKVTPVGEGLIQLRWLLEQIKKR
jgi:hypothetical protein